MLIFSRFNQSVGPGQSEQHIGGTFRKFIMAEQFVCAHAGIFFKPGEEIQMDNGCSHQLGSILPVTVTEQLCRVCSRL